jgi:hypothetical protein
MRLDGALVKVRKYIDDKFTGKRSYAQVLNGGSLRNVQGRSDGRSAADQMVLGRRGVNAAAGPRGLLGEK